MQQEEDLSKRQATKHSCNPSSEQQNIEINKKTSPHPPLRQQKKFSKFRITYATQQREHGSNQMKFSSTPFLLNIQNTHGEKIWVRIGQHLHHFFLPLCTNFSSVDRFSTYTSPFDTLDKREPCTQKKAQCSFLDLLWKLTYSQYTIERGITAETIILKLHSNIERSRFNKKIEAFMGDQPPCYCNHYIVLDDQTDRAPKLDCWWDQKLAHSVMHVAFSRKTK